MSRTLERKKELRLKVLYKRTCKCGGHQSCDKLVTDKSGLFYCTYCAKSTAVSHGEVKTTYYT